MGANEKLVPGELLIAMRAEVIAGWCTYNQQIIKTVSVHSCMADTGVTVYKNINEEINHV